jgi:ATP-dependent DNA helicase PIF1
MNDSLFDLLEFTNRSIFLTGKAGTGKTTFLNEFVKKTQKKHIVVAPTGIAAINAGGVTIHSMFSLPLRTFLPTTERIDTNYAMNIADLMPHFKYRKDKLKLLREIEIIIIDEVSMLRADVLDMMDFSLRHIRRNQQKFGGVQMLFIGDLYQLPPVVRDEHILKKIYSSPFFFESLAIKELPFITIELEKVYRQTDEDFLSILNAIRDGDKRDIDFDKLNSRYFPDFEPKEETYVYLNKMADEINHKKIRDLKTKLFTYEAKIIGDFKENQHPNEQILELKVGAQVMFIRNDATEKRYFNGKLAEVIYLDDEEVTVLLDESDIEITLKKEVWEQKRYSLDGQKNIQEEVLGSFEQYPIRLAWAVTIHKSQGLTFDRLIIDAGQSFASGQVYVALSRCRTLEGIILKSKITPDVIFSDERISVFQGATNANDQLETILSAEKFDYSIRKVLRYTDCRWFRESLTVWNLSAQESKFLDKVKAKQLYSKLKIDVDNLVQVYDKFEKILLQKAHQFSLNKIEWQEIEDKSIGAVNFFFKNTNENLFSDLKEFYSETKGIKGLKAYNEDLRTFIDDIEDYLKGLRDIKLLERYLFDSKNNVQISTKIIKVPSHILSFKLFEDGKTIPEISKERGLVTETIYGHLARFAEQGVLDIKRIFAKEKIKTFEECFNKNSFESLNDWKRELPNDFEFNEIRLLLNHFNYLKEKENA